VKVHCGEGLATHTGPESCVDDPRGRGEALTGDRTGQPLSHESLFRGADAVETAEGNMAGGVIASRSTIPRGPRPWQCVDAPCAGTGRSRGRPQADACGPHREGMEP
jgi:hypothetical protein